MNTALLVTSMAKIGGTEVATSIQASALLENNWRVSIFGELGPLSPTLTQKGITHINARIYSKNPFILLASLAKLVATLRHLNPDVVHCQMARPVPLVWAALVLSGRAWRTKLFWTSRGLEAESYPWVVPLFNRLGVRALGNCRKEADKLLRYGMHPGRTSYVYNSYRLSALDRRPERPSEPPIVIGTLAALRPDRRIDHFLLMAARFLAHTDPSLKVEFHIAGDGPARDALLAQAEELGISDKLHFIGAVSDVTNYLSQLHVMVSTAHSTHADWGAGLSNAIIEAMVVGAPVVAYDAAGISEIVQDGHTGYLVPPGDLEALTKAVIAAVTDPIEAETRAEAAYLNILQQCDPQKVLSRLLRLYQEL